MNTTEIELPEVQKFHQKARFYRDGERDLIEISYVGSKDTVVSKVKPEHMATYKREWDAFCDGREPEQRKGTALTEIMNEQQAQQYVFKNVHTLEELAVLNDGQCQSLGHGTLTLRRQAIDLLAMRTFKARDEMQKKVSEAAATIGPKPAETYASQTELAEVKQSISDLGGKMDAILAAISAKKPGRPKKTEE